MTRAFKRQQWREFNLTRKLDSTNIGTSGDAIIGLPLVERKSVRSKQWTPTGLIIRPSVVVGMVTSPIRNAIRD